MRGCGGRHAIPGDVLLEMAVTVVVAVIYLGGGTLATLDDLVGIDFDWILRSTDSLNEIVGV